MLFVIVSGVFFVFISLVKIIVNVGGGGNYLIMGVSVSVLELVIVSSLLLKLIGEYVKGGVMVLVVVSGVVKVISLVIVFVFVESVGLFFVKNFESSVISLEIKVKLI